MARRSTLRASDHDREQVADRLRHAAGEGRLLTEELEERLGAVFSARTYGELDHVVSDLPAPRDGRRHKTPLWVKATLALAILMTMIVVLAVVALIFVGLAGAWLLWVVFAWMMLGRRGRRGRHGGASRHRRYGSHPSDFAVRPPRGSASL
jgi:DUF1707 SHOCT-like domain